MTVSSTISKVTATGNGVTTSFAFGYYFVNQSDLAVYVAGVLKVLNTDYTIAGTGPYPSGANVVFGTAPANGASVVIARVVPYTQTLDLVENDPLPAEDVEKRFDLTTMMIQQVVDQLSRMPTLAITSLQSNITLDDLVADSVLIVNAAATGIEMGPTADDISNAQSYATAAAASASAAAADAITATSQAAVATAAAAGIKYKGSVRAATTTTLPACTYANGTAGVGATLTGNANGALSAQDGITLVVNEQLLVKDQASGLQNGPYVLTQVGTAGTPFILTRRTDMDNWSEVPSAAIPIEEGSTLADQIWICTSNAGGTIGTTAITFTAFSSVPADGSITNAKMNDSYINDLTNVTAALGDYVAIADVSDSSKKKKTLISSILALFGGSLAMQVFTASGTYTPTSGMKSCIAFVTGAGGGGGGGNSVGNAGGGGAGSTGISVISAATIGASQTVTIGAAGTAGGGGDGGTGGTSSLGALISATGGAGGKVGLNGLTADGGAGGTSSSAALNIRGGGGGFGIEYPAGGSGSGGAGGASFWGGGAEAKGGSGNITGANGVVYGSGGGGGSQANNGGTGAAGVVVVIELL
jgi:hypothetical protein